MKNIRLCVIIGIVLGFIAPMSIGISNPTQEPDKGFDVKEVERLIKQLDDDDWEKRESASKLLQEIGREYPDEVIPILEKRFTSDEKISPEIKMRITNTLSLLKKGWWREKLLEAPIKGRSYHSAIWTGEKMIIWGGVNGARYADGAIYDLKTNKWENLPEAPIKGRAGHTAIWTGEKMIIWGGVSGTADEYYPDGAIYNVKSNQWEKLSEAPIKGRSFHTAIWTGEKMIIWGGERSGDRVFGDTLYNNGAIYDVRTNKWEKLPKAPIKGREFHTAIWTGEKMIIWGGSGFADGAIYDLASNKWAEMPPAPIKARKNHTAIWTGEKMIIWGGFSPSGSGLGHCTDGAIYELPTPKKK